MSPRPRPTRIVFRCVVPWLAAIAAAAAPGLAADQPQWGQRHTRNQVSTERGLPDRFDPASGENVLWSAALGTECYSTPVVAAGRVLIGTNNNEPRDPRHVGDRGVMMCFDQRDGQLLWQLVVPKIGGDVYLDWPNAGICSPATVEGPYAYTVTNRDEVVCLDLDGMADGNDGPFRDEGRHMSPANDPPMEPGPLDADIVWLLDLRTAAGVRPHDSAHSSILIDGPYLYVNTSNGLNSRHDGVEKPEAPSLVVVDKRTGRLVAQERERMSRNIFHCTWSSPALGEVDRRRLVLFAGGDGVVYAFDTLPWSDDTSAAAVVSAVAGSEAAPASAGGLALPPAVESLRCVWRFDCDPGAPKENVHRYIRNRRESPSNIKSMPVFHEGRVYVTYGGDIWWGKHEAWLKCFEARGEGDITASALRWTYPVERHCCSTPSVCDGLVYAADCGGKVHCVDAETGRPYWVHDAEAEIWASTLVADGKVYVGTRRGHFWVLAAGKQRRVLSMVRLDAPVISTAVAADGVLYVGTMTRLYAVAAGAAPRAAMSRGVGE